LEKYLSALEEKLGDVVYLDFLLGKPINAWIEDCLMSYDANNKFSPGEWVSFILGTDQFSSLLSGVDWEIEKGISYLELKVSPEEWIDMARIRGQDTHGILSLLNELY